MKINIAFIFYGKFVASDYFPINTYLDECCVTRRVRINDTKVDGLDSDLIGAKCLLFADDIVLIANSEIEPQWSSIGHYLQS